MDDAALAEVLTRNPYFVSYRLERIVTRGEYLKSLGRLNAEAPTSWLSCTGEAGVLPACGMGPEGESM